MDVYKEKYLKYKNKYFLELRMMKSFSTQSTKINSLICVSKLRNLTLLMRIEKSKILTIPLTKINTLI